jgi:hypothetical protein
MRDEFSKLKSRVAFFIGGPFAMLISDRAPFSSSGVERMGLGAGQAKRPIGVIIDQQGGLKNFSPSAAADEIDRWLGDPA